jgi:hypothetical protein
MMHIIINDTLFNSNKNCQVFSMNWMGGSKNRIVKANQKESEEQIQRQVELNKRTSSVLIFLFASRRYFEKKRKVQCQPEKNVQTREQVPSSEVSLPPKQIEANAAQSQADQQSGVEKLSGTQS